MLKDTLFEDYAERIWKTPSDYGGHDPVGELTLLARHRDSSRMENHNYTRALAALQEKCAELSLPANNELAYDWRAGHWAVGWVEYIMISPEAPVEIKMLGEDLLGEIAANGLIDHEVYYEQQWEDADELYRSLSEEEVADIEVQVREENNDIADEELENLCLLFVRDNYLED